MKVKKTITKTVKKKTKGKSEDPMVKVLQVNVNPENPKNGFFELDCVVDHMFVLFLYISIVKRS